MNAIVKFSTAILLFFQVSLSAQPTKKADSVNTKKSTVFVVAKPDYKTSPYTGMTRKHWQDAAKYLLSGAFGYINNLDDAMKFPKQPGKSYPRYDGQIPTEKLEGLCRTLFMAVPLLKEDPQLTLHNIKVADYYRYQIGKLVDSSSESFIKPRGKNGGPSQNLVEFGALAVSLFAIPEVIWQPLPQAKKDALAATMLSYGDGPTVPSNWKFFNIFVLSFFKSQGYKVNETLLEDYLKKSLEHYRGEGWYNDNPAFDYYSMWAFQMYGTLWSEYFGKQYYPAYAQKFIDNFKDVEKNYPYLFSRNGEMIMWGRSITYRIGSIVPFPLMGFANNANTNFGWMRRISSGVILQFLQNPELLQDNIPTLGFYGPFEPAVQSYSCRGSVFWMGKAFLGLLVPADNVFWTAKENEGAWATTLKKGTVFNKYQPGSQILITDYPNIGASEIRAWCNVPVIGASEPFRGSENYNRLSYNSAFPWQADGANGEVAMNYVFKNKDQKWEAARMFTFKKFENGIYYRDVVMETNKKVQLSLADMPLPNGILRVDKNNSTEPVDMRLGHYALPVLKTPIKEEKRKVKGYDVRIINNGVYQLALVNVSGFTAMETVKAMDLHPVAKESVVLNAIPSANTVTPYISLMLWKKAGEKFTDAELVPIKKITNSEYGVTILMNNGELKAITY